ncbi:hypothetical protein SLEP1_g10508 [Rubroshorea leprosula]|uniref:Uncharacterized protein n=1 Tax=Rubroshorea leprosula TaxID=152421 RepID=A0AAV5IG87_9ROSI|nr:hypothetical protein SLEP1_g10508 [Rubroshorea leprosula]
MEIAKPVNNGVRLFKCNFPSTHHPLAPSFQVILVGADENLNPVCPKILKMVRHRGNAIKELRELREGSASWGCIMHGEQGSIPE